MQMEEIELVGVNGVIMAYINNAGAGSGKTERFDGMQEIWLNETSTDTPLNLIAGNHVVLIRKKGVNRNVASLITLKRSSLCHHVS